MSFRQLNADGEDNQLDWGTIAKYSAIAIVVGAAIFLVYKKVK
tara:strand:- start:6139 stop:6267 length:129 start_codon:yes stop_codon:yes gene_type:complete